jgi:hypothetical protein
LATDVPPNFMTRRPMTAGLFPDKVIGLAPTETARASQKARIHNGAVGDKQPGSVAPLGDLW